MSLARYLSKLGALLGSDGKVPSAALAAGAARANFGAGAVLQVVQVVKSDVFSTSSTSFVDIAGLSVSRTPSSPTSKILVITDLSTSSATLTSNNTRILRDGSPIYKGDTAGTRPLGLGQNYAATDYGAMRTGGVFLDSPGTSSSVTYKLQMLASGGTQYVNRTLGDRDTAQYDARSASSITLMEIAG